MEDGQKGREGGEEEDARRGNNATLRAMCRVCRWGWDGRSWSAVEGRKGGSRYDKGVRGAGGRQGELQVVGGKRKMSEGVSPEKRVGSPSSR